MGVVFELEGLVYEGDGEVVVEGGAVVCFLLLVLLVRPAVQEICG